MATEETLARLDRIMQDLERGTCSMADARWMAVQLRVAWDSLMDEQAKAARLGGGTGSFPEEVE